MEAVARDMQIFKLASFKAWQRHLLNSVQSTHSCQRTSVYRSTLIGASIAILSACNWVDSTGAQNTVAPSAVPTEQIDTGGVRIAALNEKSETVFVPTLDSIDKLATWDWGKPYQSGALAVCGRYAGFDPSTAAATLDQACSSVENCEIKFDFFRDDNDQAGFRITTPVLRAGVGLAYRLRASQAAEDLVQEELVTLCAIAINEAPIAEADMFSVEVGVTTKFDKESGVNLLSNDSDDDDLRNQKLSIDTEPVVPPALADEFTLFKNGDFIYRSLTTIVPVRGAPLTDSFTYRVTDGLSQSTARVTLRINSANSLSNQPPNVDPIEDTFLAIGDRFRIATLANDPERDFLTFELGDNTPRFVSINPVTGLLSGQPDSPGTYEISVIASDGVSQTASSFAMFVGQQIR